MIGAARMKYATRINSFLRTGLSVKEAIFAIGKIDGIDYVDMNYPEHFKGFSIEEIGRILQEAGLRLNAINLRFRDEFLAGAFDNPSADIRSRAVGLCREAAGICKQLNGQQCIIWLGFDGFDYSFQLDYPTAWKNLVSCFREVCQCTDCRISVEYKPYEERMFALLDSWGAVWKLMDEVSCSHFGVTLDFCHMLMKKENPAFAAALLLDAGKLTGIHVNDGEGSTDDGMMVGSVHVWKTLELFYYLMKYDYQDVIYFDTFPKREEAVRECELNYRMCRNFERIIEKTGIEKIGRIISENDGNAAVELMARILDEGAGE